MVLDGRFSGPSTGLKEAGYITRHSSRNWKTRLIKKCFTNSRSENYIYLTSSFLMVLGCWFFILGISINPDFCFGVEWQICWVPLVCLRKKLNTESVKPTLFEHYLYKLFEIALETVESLLFLHLHIVQILSLNPDIALHTTNTFCQNRVELVE